MASIKDHANCKYKFRFTCQVCGRGKVYRKYTFGNSLEEALDSLSWYWPSRMRWDVECEAKLPNKAWDGVERTPREGRKFGDCALQPWDEINTISTPRDRIRKAHPDW